MRKWGFFAVGLLLIVAGSWLASAIQTSGGTKIEDVRFAGDAGLTQSALLYAPAGATAQHPAPAVLISHGYINTREMQSPFAIELARRGFVVLAMDMTGHGYSEGAVGQAGFGGPAALRYLRSLPFVDKANIGMEGHSMGGGPVMAAAADEPDGYKAIVLEGSTPGLLGAKAPPNPKNLAVVFGQFDEFAPLMWQVPKGSLVATSKRLEKLFGTTGPVEVGKVYGDPAAGTARLLVNPPVTHPWEHFSRAGVGAAVDWFQKTLTGEAHPLPPNDQIWLWKEIGTLVGFGGLVFLLMGTFEVLLTLPVFSALAKPAEPVAEGRGLRWWLAFALTAAVPAATYFAFMKFGGQHYPPSRFFPQGIQNQLLFWALANALITLVLNVFLKGGRTGFTTRWIGSGLIAAATIGVGYLSLVVVDAVFKVDYRFWVLGLKPLDARHALIAIPYFIGWAVFFLISLRALCANLAVRGEGFWTQLSLWKIAMATGFAVLLVWEYATLFSTGLLATPTEPLNTIVAIQFVPLLATVGVLAAFTYRRTNSYAPGALICAALLAWYVTAGTAIHWTPGFHPPPPGAARGR
jgi:pimeloyl-ACP methyl ester carboxylesterase